MGSLWGFWQKGLRGRHSFRPGTALRTGWGWRMKMKNRSVFKSNFFFSVSFEMTVVMWTTGQDIAAKRMAGGVCVCFCCEGRVLPPPDMLQLLLHSAHTPHSSSAAHTEGADWPTATVSPATKGDVFYDWSKTKVPLQSKTLGGFCMDVLGWVLDALEILLFCLCVL